MMKLVWVGTKGRPRASKPAVSCALPSRFTCRVRCRNSRSSAAATPAACAVTDRSNGGRTRCMRSITRGSPQAKPKRMPARPWLLEKVRVTSRLVTPSRTRPIVSGRRAGSAKSAYASSWMSSTSSGSAATRSAKRRSSISVPVGLLGLQRNTALVAAVTLSRIASTSIAMPSMADRTTRAPMIRATISYMLKVTSGTITSSSACRNAIAAASSSASEPLPATRCSGVRSRREASRSRTCRVLDST